MSTVCLSLADQELGDLVREQPARARVLEHWGIDYCCGGQQTLANACLSRGLDVDRLMHELEASSVAPAIPCETSWLNRTLSELINHIVDYHHAYLREELPRLATFSDRVLVAHGRHFPQLVELRRVIIGLRDELTWHMLKEEHVLFPLIKRLELAQRELLAPPPSVCGSVQNPVQAMMAEHQDAGEALTIIRRLTNNFQPPAEACATWHALTKGLERLLVDLHLHIHEENNILFPLAILLEQQLKIAVGG